LDDDLALGMMLAIETADTLGERALAGDWHGQAACRHRGVVERMEWSKNIEKKAIASCIQSTHD
jgi:hypothetical protein